MISAVDVYHILENIKRKMCFASEAQLQMEFALECSRLFPKQLFFAF